MVKASDIIRKQFSEGDAIRDAGLTTPENIQRFDDIPYDNIDQKWNLLDVYRPKDCNTKLPVILNVHGGGWVYGDKEVYQYYCMSLAQMGFAVVNCSYRLAPEYQYPASFEDISKVCTWIQNNAEAYQFDLKHIFAVGDSAGAHMLSLFAAALTNPNFQVPYSLPKDFQFTAIALNCGTYNMEKNHLGDTAALMGELLPEGGTKAELDEISPIHYITSNYPPVFVMTCPGDFLYKAPEELIPVLKDNKVPFIYRVYGNSENPLGHVFHCNMNLDEAHLCNKNEMDFFKEFIKV